MFVLSYYILAKKAQSVLRLATSKTTPPPPLGKNIFFSAYPSKPVLGPTQPPPQQVPELLAGSKVAAASLDHLPPSRTDDKNEYDYTSTPCCAPSSMLWGDL